MLDEKGLRRRTLLKLASSPVTLFPFVAGLTTLAGTWALDMRPGFGLFVGLAGLLAAGGAFVTQLLLRGEDAARESLEEMRGEGAAAREASLDDLDARLAKDGDPRTESALRDLRTFAKAFDDERLSASGINARSAYDITEGVTELIGRCVQSLEKSLGLWLTARQMNTKAARKPILEQREQIIQEVGHSIEQLGSVLAQIEHLRTSGGAPAGLARVREELDESLKFARRVDAQMQALDNELSGRAVE